jgi:Uma2 family endonuclease
VTITLPTEHKPLTADQYARLGDADILRRAELQEGSLVMSPSPRYRHSLAVQELLAQFGASLPAAIRLAHEIDVDLQLLPPDGPGTVRQPDVVLVTAAEAERALAEDRILRASGTLLVAEIVSPGSVRTDKLIKRAEYADAGIPHYWIVELEPTVSLTACRLVDGSYVDNGSVTGAFITDQPFAIELDLDLLG